MRTKFILFAFALFTFKVSAAQQWNSYFVNAGFAVNTVDILKAGYIVTGGGQVSGDSVQVMFWSSDYGVTWNENPNDGLESWNKSIAFSDTLNGFGVGYQGRIVKTTNGGRSWGNAVFPVNRNLNKIVNVTPLIYYAVGGMKDTVQTIIKTSDGGINWQAVYDTSGPWLESVFFMNALKGFAVGDSGVILSTTNGGSSWSSITAPVQRNFYAITFINADTGYIVGGLSDSIPVRTILQTMNGGASWSVVEDQAGSSCLKDISFADSVNGYIVGDSAVLLKSTNSGQSWSQGTISGGMGVQFFTSVKFSSVNFGVVGSSGGWVYVYTNLTAPTIQDQPVIFKSGNTGDSLVLTALVNTFNTLTNVSFIYSTDSTFSTATETDSTPLNSGMLTSVSADISSLLSAPGRYYFTCKVTILGRTYFGDTLSFIVPAYFPQLTTLTGSGVTPNAITLRGQVSSLLQPSNLYFEYQGLYDTAAISVPATPSLIIDTLYHSVLANIAGLLPYTTYQVRLKATSGNAVMYGNYVQFRTTSGTTAVSTLPATGITSSSVTLEGQVGFLPFSAGVWFEYSLLGSSNIQTVTATPSSISDTAFYYEHSTVTGLLPNSYYQYRIKVSNFMHTLYGDYVYFYNGGPEIIMADSVTNIAFNNATLNGHVSNIHFPANMYFYYSPANSSAIGILATPAVIADTLTHSISAVLSGLRPYTLYNYALYAIGSPVVLQSVNPASFYSCPGYHPSLILNTEPATHVTADSATLNAMEANMPDTAMVYFDFWQSGNNPVSIVATPDSITDTLAHQISLKIGGLTANTLYLYRIKIVGPLGTVYGDSLSFYNGANTIPNFDFENWTTESGTKPAGFYNFFGPVQQISPGANGSNYAVKLQRSLVGMGGLVNALPVITGGGNLVNALTTLVGGFPYHARPDTLSGMFQYNILSGDTAYVLVEFKSAGHVVAQQFFPISGNSGSRFHQLQFPVHYLSPATPDTLILGFIPTNVYANFPQPGSTLTIDNLTFGSSYPSIPNGDFSNWLPFSFKKLDSWLYMNMLDFGLYANPDSQCVNQDTGAWHGNYAAEVNSIEVGGLLFHNSGDFSTDRRPNSGGTPDFPLNHRPVMLTGYYKFFPQNGDSFSVQCNLYKNGILVGGASFLSGQLASNYTYFTARVMYFDPQVIPDSARIEIRSQFTAALGISRAVVDYLAFDGFKPDKDSVTGLAVLSASSAPSMRIYPNPANERFTVEYMSESGGMDYLKIYDLCGKVLYEAEIGGQSGRVKKEIDLSQIASGIYLVSIQSGSSVSTGKFIVQR